MKGSHVLLDDQARSAVWDKIINATPATVLPFDIRFAKSTYEKTLSPDLPLGRVLAKFLTKLGHFPVPSGVDIFSGGYQVQTNLSIHLFQAIKLGSDGVDIQRHFTEVKSEGIK